MRSVLPLALLALLGCGASLNESIADASARFRRAAQRPACDGEVIVRRVEADSALILPNLTDEDVQRLANTGQLYVTHCENDSCYGLVVSCIDGPESCEAIGDNWLAVGECCAVRY